MMDRFLLRAQTRAVLPHGCVLHASCVAEDDRAYLFLAPSGGGKTTIGSVLCRKGFGIIADDSVVVTRGTDGTVRCLPCGTMKQSAGTENISGAPLHGVFFVEKGSPCVVVELNPAQSFYRAMRIRSIMAYGHIALEERRQIRVFMRGLFRSFPSYLIRYGPDDDPAGKIRGL